MKEGDRVKYPIKIKSQGLHPLFILLTRNSAASPFSDVNGPLVLHPKRTRPKRRMGHCPTPPVLLLLHHHTRRDHLPLKVHFTTQAMPFACLSVLLNNAHTLYRPLC